MVDIDLEARVLLEQPIVGNLGFYGLDGFPRVVPVWFRFVDGEVQVASPPGAYKSRALERDDRATLTVSTPVEPYHVVSVTGRARIDVMEEERRIAVVREIAHHYLGRERGEGYVSKWMRGGHPGPGDLIRLPAERVRYTNVTGH
jgi:nitroimidazol reductase NimA-like FMN-containing flavoprotein (pyridoxamine 5'-phosphate oxidase superfamily)